MSAIKMTKLRGFKDDSESNCDRLLGFGKQSSYLHLDASSFSHQALSMGEGTKVTEIVETSGQEAAGVAVGSAETPKKCGGGCSGKKAASSEPEKPAQESAPADSVEGPAPKVEEAEGKQASSAENKVKGGSA
ncbi:hypothetical protein PCASD_02923 [Puccinia coronata f. sp. avenae]|uniref:Uncharacterized protein n=1 Tax=Puccinia coronata f. sp. avenae TaxID=200324 RepID=A0A2N5VEJ0_9BASI|nr:hypothetical protein PCASD_02923 [Puccinia coronata f. sp. avenae]